MLQLLKEGAFCLVCIENCCFHGLFFKGFISIKFLTKKRALFQTCISFLSNGVLFGKSGYVFLKSVFSICRKLLYLNEQNFLMTMFTAYELELALHLRFAVHMKTT